MLEKYFIFLIPLLSCVNGLPADKFESMNLTENNASQRTHHSHTTLFQCCNNVETTSFDHDVPARLKLSFSTEINGDYLFQGDMLVRKHTLDIALEGGDVDNFVPARAPHVPGQPKVLAAAVGMASLKWEGGVLPYVISDNAKCGGLLGCFSSLGRPEDVIKTAMREWSRKTCIKFIERTTETDYIEFVNDGYGKCFSYIGRIRGKQVLSLASGCSKHGTALHEIGHALGLHHEQSRPDRDEYVKIYWDNIQSDAKLNFKKYKFSQVNGLGSPYDYDSIMHYPKRAFGKWPWSTTIKPKKNVEIGQRDHLSKYDAKTINKYYNCPTKA